MDNKLINTPGEAARISIEIGEHKTRNTAITTLLLGIMAGIFLSFGGVAYMMVSGNVADHGLGKFLGGSIFPVGLILIVLGGGELFTGNNLMTMGLLQKKYSSIQMARNWVIVWVGNMIGSMFIAYLVVRSGMLSDPNASSGLSSAGDFAVSLAHKKVSLDFIQLLLRGILCNLIVSLAVLVSNVARDGMCKIFLIWFPIAAFVIAGYEHCVANMLYITSAILLGAEISWAQFFMGNLVPVTVGNIIGGGVIIPVLYWYLYVRGNDGDQDPAYRANDEGDSARSACCRLVNDIKVS